MIPRGEQVRESTFSPELRRPHGGVPSTIRKNARLFDQSASRRGRLLKFRHVQRPRFQHRDRLHPRVETGTSPGRSSATPA